MSIHTNDPSVVELALLAYNGYKGRTFQVDVTDQPVNLHSYWDGGSRDYHKVIRLSTKEVVEVPQNGTIFVKGIENNKFPCSDIAVVTHRILQGKDLGIIISIHPDNMNQLVLPEKTDLTPDELIVLFATRSLKNTYAGQTGIRFKTARIDTKITELEWGHATHSLIEKGMLDKRGAITNSGRNALQEHQIGSFRQLRTMKVGGE